MDKMFAVASNLTALQPKIDVEGVFGNLQDKKRLAARDIGNLAVPGAVDGTGLKFLLGKVANQGLLELDGSNYMVKGYAKKASKSKGRKKSAGGKKGGKKASKSKGRKKSAGPKKGKKGEEELPK